MKRAEVIRRLEGVAYEGDGETTAGYENKCVAYARALGIEVEPDEDPLPDVLYTTVWLRGGRRPGQVVHLCNDEWHVSFDGLNAAAVSCLQTLAQAYNNRPRWRTETPALGADYLVKTTDGECVVARYINVGLGYWNRPDVVAWMPLPPVEG